MSPVDGVTPSSASVPLLFVHDVLGMSLLLLLVRDILV
jgi:hypothetical protein